jgi:hypothetical protein
MPLPCFTRSHRRKLMDPQKSSFAEQVHSLERDRQQHQSTIDIFDRLVNIDMESVSEHLECLAVNKNPWPRIDRCSANGYKRSGRSREFSVKRTQRSPINCWICTDCTISFRRSRAIWRSRPIEVGRKSPTCSVLVILVRHHEMHWRIRRLSLQGSAAYSVKRNYVRLGLLAYECQFDRAGMDPRAVIELAEMPHTVRATRSRGICDSADR